MAIGKIISEIVPKNGSVEFYFSFKFPYDRLAESIEQIIGSFAFFICKIKIGLGKSS